MFESVSKENFDDIWLFVEDKLQTPIPSYFKNVLKVCGYNNGLIIGSIEDDDIAYIESEVRNGNVTKYFVDLEEKDVLEGSTKKKENFEFTMGHKKFLKFIVNFLKTYTAEHGSNCFSSGNVKPIKLQANRLKSKRNSRSQITVAPNKKKKYSVLESAIDDTKLPMRDTFIGEKSHLLTKALFSLVNHSPVMYVETCVRDIEMKLTTVSYDLVTIGEMSEETSNERRFIGTITCPFCSKKINVAHSNVKLANGLPGKPWWNTSNFDSHLKAHHCDVELKEKTMSEVLSEDCHNTNAVTTSFRNPTDKKTEQETSTNAGMLQNFNKSAERNFDRSKPGYRHDITTKMFAGYMKMVGGLLSYETLHANFPLSLPSVSTVNRFITDYGPQVVEGEMRTNELLEYLQNRNMPLRISLSEDATRITPKISYEPKTNQLVGFALPLDMNGMPVVSSFPARNVREIHQHFTNPSNFVSSTVYVQMAQPTEPNSSPFCLMMYCTDCKFTALNIYNRWQFQANKLNEIGIKIYNISSDGDSRPLMAMKVLSRIGQQDRSYLDYEWFSCGGFVETTFTQDYVHIITKMRNRILTYSRIFPIGNYIISSSHLKYLIDNVSKDKHLLTNSDIEPKDRQNFLSAEKICSENTMKCLLDYVPGSEGTVIYLKVMRSVLNAFQETEITSEERIYLIWYACFFCRAWRSWIMNSEKSKMSAHNRPKSYYNLKENFLSSNCYTCIELNAHTLVKQVLVEDSEEEPFSQKEMCNENVVKHCPEEYSASERSKYFFPGLFDSQVCESIFRQVRSFTSTFCTVVNFTILDILNRIRKVQLQNEIINVCKEEIKFPRFEKKTADTSRNPDRQQFNDLSRKTIISQIEKARDAVIVDLENLDIDTSQLNFNCQIQPAYEKDMTQKYSDIDCESSSDEEDAREDVELHNEHENELNESGLSGDEEDDDDKFQHDVNLLSGITGELMLKNYDGKLDENSESDLEDDVSLNERSPFTRVVDNTGKRQVVRKSAVCYVLTKDKQKLSSDRLQRVKEKEYVLDRTGNRSVPNADNFHENNEIGVGDWCIFPYSAVRDDDVEYDSNTVLLGLVLGFTYFDGNTFKEREFSKSFATVRSNFTKNVGVLCDFYNFNAAGALKIIPDDKHNYIKMNSYIGTIKAPTKVKKNFTISENLVDRLNKIDL